jgi:hypothetical protein
LTCPGPVSTEIQQQDLSTFGVEQAIVGVEFMLKEAMEKAKYGKADELERYVVTCTLC